MADWMTECSAFTSHDLISACVSAKAAVAAAKITAKSGVKAAIIQLAAAGAAILAGFLAYIGAVAAARVQLAATETRTKRETMCYVIELSEITVSYRRHLKNMVTNFQNCEQNLPTLTVPEELTFLHWRDHAMLETKTIGAIRALNTTIRFINNDLANKQEKLRHISEASIKACETIEIGLKSKRESLDKELGKT